MPSSLPQLPEAQRQGIRHHLIDVLPPAAEFSAGDFFELGRRAAEDILRVSIIKLPPEQVNMRHQRIGLVIVCLPLHARAAEATTPKVRLPSGPNPSPPPGTGFSV